MAFPWLPFLIGGGLGAAVGAAANRATQPSVTSQGGARHVGQLANMLMQQYQQMLNQGQNQLAQQASGMAQQGPPSQAITQNLMQQLGQFTGQFQPNQLLQQAQQQVQQGQQQPGVWGSAQQTIQQRLAPGYTAFSPQESDAMFRQMQERIAKEFDRQRQATVEDLNRRGLYRTGLYDQHISQLGERQAEATQRAATDVYLAGQEATRQAQAQALSAALGLGGQQASFAQQQLANLMGLGQYLQGQQLQAQLLPFQLGAQVHGMASDDYRTQFQNLLAAATLQHQLGMAPFQAGLSLYQAFDPAAARASQERIGQQQAMGNMFGSALSLLPFLFL